MVEVGLRLVLLEKVFSDDQGAGCEEERERGDSEPEVRGGTGGISEANSRTPGTDRGLGALEVVAAGLRIGFVPDELEVEGLTFGD